MAITEGSALNSVASSQKQTLSTNYLDLAATANEGWAQQYVPDLMEKEAEVFGNRTISGFLSQIGAEEPMTADQVVWSEQSRLHISLKGTIDLNGGDSNQGLFTVITDIDGNVSGDGFTVANHGVRANDTVLLSSGNNVVKAIVHSVSGAAISVKSYDTAVLEGLSEVASATTLLVYGSEFKKGDTYGGSDARTANEPTFTSFSNKPII